MVSVGELLAAFEMFELGGEYEKLPELPNAKDVMSLDFGPILPVPPHIRPSLVKYRWTGILMFYNNDNCTISQVWGFVLGTSGLEKNSVPTCWSSKSGYRVWWSHYSGCHLSITVPISFTQMIERKNPSVSWIH